MKIVMKLVSHIRNTIPIFYRSYSYDVLDENSNEIGFVTSGTQSPSSGKSIALAIIDRDAFEMGKKIVQIRKRQVEAKIVKNQIEK